MATPFVQGRLHQTDLTCAIETECAITGRTIRMTIDSELRYQVLTEGARPMLFIPLIDLPRLDAPCIVDDF